MQHDCKCSGRHRFPPDFCNRGCQSCQGNCHCCFLTTLCATHLCLFFVLCLLVMATCYISSSPHHAFSCWSLWFITCFCLCKVILQVTVALRLVDWQLPGARFFPKPVPTPRTEAQGLLKCSMADIQHCLATLSSRKWLPYCFIYCQQQLALTLMANYFVQVISLKTWEQTRLAHWKKMPFFWPPCVWYK